MTRHEPAPHRSAHHLADFTITWSVLRLLPLAAVIGALAAGVALGLLDLIGLVTHLAYDGDVGISLIAPSTHRLHAFSVLIPVLGGAVIGAMAYFGSERIRGHGIPEAMETILVGGSKVEPRLGALKPISSVISIGTGGPFGAEGPIIMTGGALGSILAQYVHLTAIERRCLLVAGSCAGMAAIFGTPVAAVIFGVELLVFELKPRSYVPIAIAVSVAAVLRNTFAAHHLILAAPLFPVARPLAFSSTDVALAAALGIIAGLLVWVVTGVVYGMEDAFKRLPIHWAWWPAIGGAAVGLGGLVDPRVLGVGYGTIAAELTGKLALGALALLLVTKLAVWSVALGSGTSGGILAPLLIIGAALGGLAAHVIGDANVGAWALIGMAGTLAGVTRSPLTSIVFAFELTHDVSALVPLLTTCSLAFLVSALVLKRSILTEKVARKGFHVVREYAVDPLEAMFVREVMSTEVVSIAADASVEDLDTLLVAGRLRAHEAVVVVDDEGRPVGVLATESLAQLTSTPGAGCVAELIEDPLEVVHDDDTLRQAADRMAAGWAHALPVVEREDGQLAGMLTVPDLLGGRQRQLTEERHRERPLRLRQVGPRRQPR